MISFPCSGSLFSLFRIPSLERGNAPQKGFDAALDGFRGSIPSESVCPCSGPGDSAPVNNRSGYGAVQPAHPARSRSHGGGAGGAAPTSPSASPTGAGLPEVG